MFVSIHAPVKSATVQGPHTKRSGFCFNPRARKERDIVPVVKWTERKGFNPRARKERDFSQRWLLLY